MHWKEEHPGFISIISSLQNTSIEKILDKWHSQVKNGHIKRITDSDIDLPVFQIIGVNVDKNFISLPEKKGTSLQIKMPILVLLVKNLDKYFKFQVIILDDKGSYRTFISLNYATVTKIKPFQCSMPLQLEDGWNQVVFDLEQYCQKAFGTHYVQCVKIKIHANCRFARIYFNDVPKHEDQIPSDYKLFLRVQPYKI